MAIWERLDCRICGIRKRGQGSGDAASLGAILERYVGADGNQRLNLWLQHRDLRKEFGELEEMYREKGSQEGDPLA